MRVVLDTNVLVSAIIRPQGVAAQVLRHLRLRHYELLASRTTFDELVTTIYRPRLQVKYGLTEEALRPVLKLIYLRSIILQPQIKITACRDPKDDIYLEVAIAGQADAIVTGDGDLLSLHPFRSIPIITPSEFLAAL
jgi:putative PIN family toxin of toxin-antitoxin system